MTQFDRPPFETGSNGQTGLQQLNERSRTILRRIVESYLTTGEPVGSRNLSRALPIALSPASIRNVMSDLEHLGLIISPHTSAGRMPTQLGLRMFVDGLLEVGDITQEERRQIETQIAYQREKSVDQLLTEAGEMMSGLSHCAGVVLAEKQVARLKHIEFVPLEPGKGLVVLVDEDQNVENRIIALPAGLPPSALHEASNYLNTHIRGLTISEARSAIEKSLKQAKAELDTLTQKVIKAGLAEWSGSSDERKSLIVRGQGNLLKDVTAAEDLERIRQLFDDFESQRDIVQLLGASELADGVRIFIGSENKLFSMSGSSLVVAPFRDETRRIVGVLGVIGPTRLNYARIIPMVDYTAKLISRLIT
ncbi:MAG: heat-inducible transcriptional repressor HrcA [Hyphomicrobium sp.]|nr:MAG: heat-inducible transcriptional repressor HrcA [Hyphomicrobium sp.]PPD00633.1 MAG: heat-inducible transcriptional repressor HrcA [Hyphomicrobium sp.]